MITDSSQDSAPAGLPAVASGACRVPEPGAVEAEFAGVDGTLVQRRWVEAAVAVRFEQLAPVAAFPVVPGRRWGPGWWWSSTTGRHQMHGSQAMCTQLMVLDREPQVVGLSARPVRLIWRDPDSGRALTWVPQLFARYADGRALLADCPATSTPAGIRAERAAAAGAAACTAAGFTYRRQVPPDKVVAANVRRLAGYRHPRHRDAGRLEHAVMEALTTPQPLIAGAPAAGETPSALPVLYHALRHGRPATDLTRPLREHTLHARPGHRQRGAGAARQVSRHKVTAPGGRCVEEGAHVRFEARTWQVSGPVDGRVHLAADGAATGCVPAARLVAADGFEVLGQAAPQIPAATVWAALQLPARERAMAWWDAQAQAEQW